MDNSINDDPRGIEHRGLERGIEDIQTKPRKPISAIPLNVPLALLPSDIRSRLRPGHRISSYSYYEEGGLEDQYVGFNQYTIYDAQGSHVYDYTEKTSDFIKSEVGENIRGIVRPEMNRAIAAPKPKRPIKKILAKWETIREKSKKQLEKEEAKRKEKELRDILRDNFVNLPENLTWERINENVEKAGRHFEEERKDSLKSHKDLSENKELPHNIRKGSENRLILLEDYRAVVMDHCKRILIGLTREDVKGQQERWETFWTLVRQFRHPEYGKYVRGWKIYPRTAMKEEERSKLTFVRLTKYDMDELIEWWDKSPGFFCYKVIDDVLNKWLDKLPEKKPAYDAVPEDIKYLFNRQQYDDLRVKRRGILGLAP